MHAKFVPNAHAVGPVEFRPFMLEIAWDYCQTVLRSEHQRGMILQTVGALALEIVLKSFNAKVTGNPGELSETYEFDRSVLPKRVDAHNLKALMEALRGDVRAYLLDTLDEETLVEHQNTFTHSRYHYERTAPHWSSDEALKLAVKLICKVLYLYKQQGCSDPFVSNFAVDSVYFKHVQPLVACSPSEA